MMYKHLASVILGGAGLVALGSLPSTAAIVHDERVPAGRVAWHFVTRFAPVQGNLEFLAFITHLDGYSGPLFSGVPGVATAHFTLRVSKSAGPPTTIAVSTDTRVFTFPAGAVFDIWYDATPNQDFGLPDTFSDGTFLATFEGSVLQVTQTQVGTGLPVLSISRFSSELVHSHRVNIDGKTVDFGKIVPGGVTIHNFNAGDALRGGTAVAIESR